MAKIKNTPTKNVFGGGYEKEITLDNGEKYIIKNTPTKNVFGGGYEQKIVKEESNGGHSFVADLILGAGGLLLMWLLWVLMNNIDKIFDLIY